MDVLFENVTTMTGYSLHIDLEQQRITDAHGLSISFDIAPFYKTKLLQGLDDIGLTLLKEDKIAAYEKSSKLLSFK